MARDELEQLLARPAGAPLPEAAQAARRVAEPEPREEYVAPRRRRVRRVGYSDFTRWRFRIAAAGGWLAGGFLTYTVLNTRTGLDQWVNIGLATALTVALSAAQSMLWGAPGFATKLGALVLVSVDALLNVAGADLLVPTMSIPFDPMNSTFWIAMLPGAALGIYPELFWNESEAD